MFHFGAGGGMSACSFGKVCGEAGPQLEVPESTETGEVGGVRFSMEVSTDSGSGMSAGFIALLLSSISPGVRRCDLPTSLFPPSFCCSPFGS